ncbi:MAG TPA: hypothetical protein VK932_22505 [Kofleriaceae bacterium]|nr:hypothetical protein [Kofleriaceae bacterium]
MRALVHAAVLQVLLTGTAAADRQSVTFRGVQIDLDATQPLALTREADGIVVYATISLDAASCRNLPALPAGTRRVCRELPDRAIVVTYRGAPPPPPPPPAVAPPEPPPEPAVAAPPPPDLDHLAQSLAAAVVDVYGTADWVEGNFRPRWAEGELPLLELPPGTWKLSDRGDTFELHEIGSRSHIRVTRLSCARFWAAPPAGRRVEAPGFLPAGTRAAVVDERARWVSASCIEMLGADVAVTIDLPHEPDEDAARAFARALARAETEVAYTARSLISVAVLAGAGSLGLSVEGWYAARISSLAQLEAIDAGAGEEGEIDAVRLALGFGPGIARARWRAAVHAGFGIEGAPMKRRAGDDHIGGSLFIDGRALAEVGPLVVQGIARGALYFDIDCTDTINPDKLCGESDSSDHRPRLGGEAEARIGYTFRGKLRRLAYYGGLRYFATSTGDRVEHGGLVSAGAIYW